jgi:transposase
LSAGWLTDWMVGKKGDVPVGPNRRGMGGPRQPSYEDLLALIAELREDLAAARERIAELEGRAGGGPCASPPGVTPRRVPSWVKANRPPKPEGESGKRKKRAENHARKLEPPTEVVVHSLERCPDCGHRLSPGWEHRRRQVLDLPAVPYIVRDHVVMGHHCGVCRKNHIAPLDLSGEVVGQHRVSIRIMALVAYLKTECRLPLSSIRGLLHALHGLSLSVGELTRLLRETAVRGRAQYEAFRAELRSSPVVHADETGWREDGVNGYLWGFVTPSLRWFTRDQSRASAVPLAVLGERFDGVVVADFYSGYSPLACRKQRCWVHLLRDVKELEEAHPKSRSIAAWRERIRSLYEQAKDYRATQLAMEEPVPLRVVRARTRARGQFERALLRLARPYLAKPSDPRHILAQRIEQFRWEMFPFIEHPEVPPENNLAERALRPTVIARKVSGGTRSPRGSETMSILRTLFGTWPLRGLAPLEACLTLLASNHA